MQNLIAVIILVIVSIKLLMLDTHASQAQTADLHNGGTVHDVIKCTFLQQRWMWLVDGSHNASQLGLRKITQRYGANSASEHPENTEDRRAHTFRSPPQVIEQLMLE